MSIEHKLNVLSRVGQALNDARVTWAVGASLLLYLSGIGDDFNDIDILTIEQDAARAKQVLLKLGKLAPAHDSASYKSKHFMEFCVDGADIDVIAGFVIVKDGIAHDCALNVNDIVSRALVNGVQIPLHSVKAWRGYYALMGRADKIELIDRSLSSE